MLLRGLPRHPADGLHVLPAEAEAKDVAVLGDAGLLGRPRDHDLPLLQGPAEDDLGRADAVALGNRLQDRAGQHRVL